MDEEAVTLIVFFALAYAITWTLFTVVATTIQARTPLGYSLVVAGAFAPATVALSLTAWQEGGRGVRRLLNRLLIADVPARYYAFALSYIVAIKLAAAALHRVLLGAWPRFGSEPWILIPLAIAVSTPFQAGEEIGWRGYALPRLAARFGLARASLLLGVLWAGWHVPQFYIAGGDTYHQSFPVWGAEVVAMSVAFAWLYAGPAAACCWSCSSTPPSTTRRTSSLPASHQRRACSACTRPRCRHSRRRCCGSARSGSSRECLDQLPVGTMVAASTIRITVRSGARGRCMTPRGTTKPCCGSSVTDRSSMSMMNCPDTT